MKKTLLKVGLLAIIGLAFTMCTAKYAYQTVENDPLNLKIYTLKNGLKVYMSVNKDKPRIQTAIAVRVGGKNDPAQTTGLAHYFEHLMFKGTEQFGTQDYVKEKVFLDQIEAKFEVYRTLTDSVQRAKIYAEIDSLSYQASRYSIPNEYDKLMAAIGAEGTNAFTSEDMTVYVEDIPSNQIDNWAKIQADRFKHNVIRGFHTELETVYEEKNMSLTRDAEKVSEAIASALYPNHPYGTQTVLGTQEHLKNPSIVNIKNYYKKWYVPNNMAICVSGDFNPDEMVATIEKYFADMQANDNLQYLEIKPEVPITSPIEKEVYGLESESITLAWRFPGQSHANLDTLSLLSNILYNGEAGLIDLGVNNAQKLLSCRASDSEQPDYTTFIMEARPKEKQTLDQAKEVMLEQLELLKKGEFSQDLLKATVNNYKKDILMSLEDNMNRTYMMINSFIAQTNWQDDVQFINRLEKLTKEDVVKYANKYFSNNYVVVKKLRGKDLNEKKISKPKITPILTNRDTSSAFLKEIQLSAAAVTPIEPVFLDFTKDLDILKANNGIDILYKQNTSNDLFSLTILTEKGVADSKLLDPAVSYFEYLGTNTMTAKEIGQKLYNLACSFNISASVDRTFIKLSGLSENTNEALALAESKLADIKGDDAILANLKEDILKGRINSKLNQNQCFRRLSQYLVYGAVNPLNFVLSNKELSSVTSDALLNEIKGLFSNKHKVLYYGPMSKEEVLDLVNKNHKVAQNLNEVKHTTFKMKLTETPAVYIAPYDAKQIYMLSYSNKGETFDVSRNPILEIYNNYFGGGMNSIVFQEMREARGLAYSAGANYKIPNKLENNYVLTTMIATQNDKMMDAITAFEEILNNMPQSENAFKIAKESLIASIRTERIINEDILWSYIQAQNMGLNYDTRKDLFEKAKNFTLMDVVKFQQENVKGRIYNIGILGDKNQLDIKSLTPDKYGKIVNLSLEEIFGY